MGISVARRLALVGAVGVVSVGAVAGVAMWGAATQGDDAAAMARISGGMSRQWNADMMHDGIRGDVMAALYATTPAQREQLEVDGVTEKAPAMVEHVTAAAAVAPPDVKQQFDQVIPVVEAYGQQAVELVELAADDKAAAIAQLPLFLERFAQLEEDLGAVDDAMLGAVSDREARRGAPRPRGPGRSSSRSVWWRWSPSWRSPGPPAGHCCGRSASCWPQCAGSRTGT